MPLDKIGYANNIFDLKFVLGKFYFTDLIVEYMQLIYAHEDKLVKF